MVYWSGLLEWLIGIVYENDLIIDHDFSERYPVLWFTIISQGIIMVVNIGQYRGGYYEQAPTKASL